MSDEVEHWEKEVFILSLIFAAIPGMAVTMILRLFLDEGIAYFIGLCIGGILLLPTFAMIYDQQEEKHK